MKRMYQGKIKPLDSALGSLRVLLLDLPVNPFTPESDQCQNSPAASQEI